MYFDCLRKVKDGHLRQKVNIITFNCIKNP